MLSHYQPSPTITKVEVTFPLADFARPEWFASSLTVLSSELALVSDPCRGRKTNEFPYEHTIAPARFLLSHTGFRIRTLELVESLRCALSPILPICGCFELPLTRCIVFSERRCLRSFFLLGTTFSE